MSCCLELLGFQVPCILRYWDPTQKSFISYKDFHLSENTASSIPLPDPTSADPSEVIVAAEWQMVVDVTVDIDYPDDGRLVFANTSFSDTPVCKGVVHSKSCVFCVVVYKTPILWYLMRKTLLQKKYFKHSHWLKKRKKERGIAEHSHANGPRLMGYAFSCNEKRKALASRFVFLKKGTGAI